MHSAVVALMPACGEAAGFQGSGLHYKALLPLNGRPLADYTLSALQASNIERIFIVQPYDGSLEKLVSPSKKNIFVTYPGVNSSLANSLAFGARAILDYYADKIKQMAIIGTPSDIPLVRPEDYNYLIDQYYGSDADVCLTAVPNKLLKREYPGRSFRSLYLRDLGEEYSLQSTTISKGSLIGYREDAGGKRFTLLDHDGLPIRGLEEMTDYLRLHRRGIFIWPLLMHHLFFKRLARKGYLRSGFRLVGDMLRRSVTLEEVTFTLNQALNWKFGLLISKSTGFSLDVDVPKDLEKLQKSQLSENEIQDKYRVKTALTGG
jgi:CTP:molybdopterin cytidylyltransferase MocA